MVEAATACLPPRDRATRALPLATELWDSLHGIVDLRITKPERPWPAPDVLVVLICAAVTT